VQAPELLDDEEQEDDHGPSRVQEVLQQLPEAPAAQGNEVKQLSAVSPQPSAGRGEPKYLWFPKNKLKADG
jgi:hypothetical protein